MPLFETRNKTEEDSHLDGVTEEKGMVGISTRRTLAFAIAVAVLSLSVTIGCAPST